jgi:aminoglycoside phosphotransferase (APT) family kinase protein
VLALLSDTPAPLVVAADPEAAFCDVPALVLTRLPGRAPGLPGDMDAFIAQLAQTLTEIHAVDAGAREPIPAYRSDYDPAVRQAADVVAAPAALGACDRGRL